MTELEDLRTGIDAVITRALSESRSVGTVVLIAHNGELVYQHAAGLADRESGTALPVDTLFRLASVTKAIVSALTATISPGCPCTRTSGALPARRWWNGRASRGVTRSPWMCSARSWSERPASRSRRSWQSTWRISELVEENFWHFNVPEGFKF
jgi:hypothetical protein